MLQIERELTTRYSNIHNKFFPQPKPKVEKPKRAIPGNNAVLVSPLDFVSVLDWNISFNWHHAKEDDNSVGLATRHPTVDQIVRLVNKDYGYSKAELGGPLRTRRIVRCRHIIYYLVCRHTLVSSPVVGRMLRCDHTTILYGRNKIAFQRRIDQELDVEVALYEVELRRMVE